MSALIAVTGPTASGKTALSVTLARALDAELVGADSVQVYRGFDIGASKPTREELGGVPHHLLDVADPDAPLDAADFARMADAAIADVRGRGRVPIVVGGSGLWLRALLRGLVDLPAPDPALRTELRARLEREGSPALHAALAQVDPDLAASLHPRDAVRILRGLEVHTQTGQPLSALRAAHALGAPRYRCLRVVLDPRANVLHARIAQRTAAMIAAGFVEEVQRLVARWGREVRPLSSVGYRQMLAHVCDGAPLDETVRQVEKATRTYARRQRTWLRSEPGPTWTVQDGAQVCSEAGLARLRTHLAEHGDAPA